jgi:hypothetical protein
MQELALLDAYEILGDPLSAPSERAAALGTLGRSDPSARAAARVSHSQSCSGRMTDRPRAALPGPRQGIHLQSGCTAVIDFVPQVAMRGPYWLGLTNAADLVLSALVFGNVSAFCAPGEVPGMFFDVGRPEHLIAIAGAAIAPGLGVRATIRNVSCLTLLVQACLWGNSEASIALAERAAPGGSAPSSARVAELAAEVDLLRSERLRTAAALDRLQMTVRELEEARGVERELLIPEVAAERARRVEHQTRSHLDRAASLAHHAVSVAGFEPGDVWETPSDES